MEIGNWRLEVGSGYVIVDVYGIVNSYTIVIGCAIVSGCGIVNGYVIVSRLVCNLEFGAWNLFVIWCLGFGILTAT